MVTARLHDGAAFGRFFFFYFAFMGLFSPFLSLYLDGLGHTAVQIGVLMSLLQALRIVGPNVWGWWADYIGDRARLMRWLVVVAACLFVGVVVGRDFSTLVIVMFGFHLFLSGLVPVGEALTVDHLGTDFARYGRIRLWGSIGFVLAVLAGGYVLDVFGVALWPWLEAALLLLTVDAVWRLRDASHARPREPASNADVWRLLRRADVRWFLVSCFLMIFAHAAMYAYLSLYLTRAGYGPTAVGVLWALGVLAEIAFFYFQPRVLAHVSLGKLLTASFVVTSVRFLVTAWWVDVLAVMVLAQLAHAITFAAHHAACMGHLRRWFSGRLVARGQALYTSVSYGLGGTLGGLVATQVWDLLSPSACFVVSAGAAALGGVAAWRLGRVPYVETKGHVA